MVDFALPAMLSVKAGVGVEVQVPDASISLRGLCVVDANVAWVCGSKGAVLRTEDGGKHWFSVSPAGFSKLEFRSIHAWSRDVACIASAGTPAVLLRTQDGGKSWKETYRHPSENAFFDSMQFWNDREGVAVSDPVDGKWVVLNTNDRGQSWSNRLGGDIRAPGKEAAFAASNGSLFAALGKEIWLGTGGEVEGAKAAVYLLRPDKNHRLVTPIRSHASAGIFAVDVSEEGSIVVVGGDYQKVDQVDSTAAWSHDGGQTWFEAEVPPRDFDPRWSEPRSRCVAIFCGGSQWSRSVFGWKELEARFEHRLPRDPLGKNEF